MSIVKVKDHINLVRMNGSSISNTDEDGYRRAKERRAKALTNIKRLEELEQKVESLDEKLDSILFLLQKGVNNGNA